MDIVELIQALVSLGVGGAIAGVVLYWKRQDDIRFQQTLEQVIGRDHAVIEANTAAITSLIGAVSELAKIDDLESRMNAMLRERRRQ